MDLLVNSIAEAVWVDGSNAETPSVIVALQGCPVGCTFCNAKHTWEMGKDNYVSQTALFYKVDDGPEFTLFEKTELFETLLTYESRHIVFTGGEPCLYNLRELTGALCDAGRTVQIETSGTFPIRVDERVWVTLCPKNNRVYTVLDDSYRRANEIVYLMTDENDLELVSERVLALVDKSVPFWIKTPDANVTDK